MGRRFEQFAQPVGLASGEQRWEIWFFCKSHPKKMAMAARHTAGQWTHEVCRPHQWVSDSLTHCMDMGATGHFISAMQGTGGGFSTCRASDPDPTQTAVAETSKRHRGVLISSNGLSGCKRGGLCATPPMKWYKLMVTGWVGGGVAHVRTARAAAQCTE